MQKHVTYVKKTITLNSKPRYQGYSYGFKVAIIEHVENGQLSINQAGKEYGDLDRKPRNMQDKSPKQEIVELRKKLKEAEKKVMIWETAMEMVK